LSDIAILPFHDRFLDQVCRVTQGHWSPDLELNGRYLAWKYQANPYADDCRLYLAMDGAEVSGIRGYYALRWVLHPGGEPTTVLMAADLCVRPDYRGQGISRKLIQESVEDLSTKSRSPFLMNTSAGKSTLLEMVASGWQSLGRFDVSDRRPNLTAPLRRWAQGEEGLESLDRAPREPGISITREVRPGPMAELAGRTAASGVRLHRDEAYFRWRFSNPLCRYRFLYAGGTDLDAYLVVQCWTTHDQEWINLVDYAYEDERPLETLLSTLIDLSGHRRMRVWTPTNESLRQVFGRAGFQPTEYAPGVRDPRPALLLRSLRSDTPTSPQPPRDFSLWERSMAVSDYY